MEKTILFNWEDPAQAGLRNAHLTISKTVTFAELLHYYTHVIKNDEFLDEEFQRNFVQNMMEVNTEFGHLLWSGKDKRIDAFLKDSNSPKKYLIEHFITFIS